jgi:hypothetical protein
VAAAALAIALFAVPEVATAAACCMSATSFGLGRLLAWEDYALGLQLGHARSLGQWDSRATLRWNGSKLSDGVTRVEPWAIVRLHERVQAQAWAPFVLEDRRASGLIQVAGGLGDVGVAIRYEPLGIGEYQWLPSVALTFAALAPTGKRVEETSPPLFAGATGRGAWGGSLAVALEYAFFPWFVKLDAGATAYLPFQRSDDGAREQYGPLLQAALSAGRELVPDVLVAAVALTAERESALRVDGASVPSSGAYSYALAGSLSWHVDPRWTLVANVTNTVWPDGAGMNRDARIGFTIGVRHGHF